MGNRPISKQAKPLVIVCEDLHNLGDLAILLQNLEVERRQRDIIHVRSWSKLSAAITATVAEAGGTIVDGRSFGALFRLLRGADMIIGGGQLVRDNSSPAALCMLLAAVGFVRMGGGRVETRGLGVSRLRRRPHRLLWRCILGLSRRIYVRDDVSRENVRALVGGWKTSVTADMVFLPGRINTMFSNIAPEDGGDRVLIVQCIDPSEGRSIEADVMPTLLEALGDELPHAPINVVPHDYRPHMDMETMDYMATRYEAIEKSVVNTDHSLPDLVRTYSRATLVVTNRLHSVIFALLASRPVLAIDDGTGKVLDIARKFDLPTLSIKRRYTREQVTALVHDALNIDPAEWRVRKNILAGNAARNLT